MVRARCRLRQRSGFATAFAVGFFAFEVGARWRVHACLGDRDLVQRSVELAIAAAVEPVALVFAAACLEWGDAGVTGELRVAVETVDRADLGEQLRCGDRSAAGQRAQAGRRDGRPCWSSRSISGIVRVSVRQRPTSSRAIRFCTVCAPRAKRRAEPVKPDRPIQSAHRDVQRRVELVQQPAQAVTPNRRMMPRRITRAPAPDP